MLALITLESDLPTPRAVRFHPGGEILALDFDGIAEGLAWSRFLGGRTETYVRDGHRYLRPGVIDWRGWSVQLHASEPADPHAEQIVLDEDTTARLRSLLPAGVDLSDDYADAMAADRAADPYPDCPDQYHGADSGPCPSCKWDSHPVTAS